MSEPRVSQTRPPRRPFLQVSRETNAGRAGATPRVGRWLSRPMFAVFRRWQAAESVHIMLSPPCCDDLEAWAASVVRSQRQTSGYLRGCCRSRAQADGKRNHHGSGRVVGHTTASQIQATRTASAVHSTTGPCCVYRTKPPSQESISRRLPKRASHLYSPRRWGPGADK